MFDIPAASEDVLSFSCIGAFPGVSCESSLSHLHCCDDHHSSLTALVLQGLNEDGDHSKERNNTALTTLLSTSYRPLILRVYRVVGRLGRQKAGGG